MFKLRDRHDYCIGITTMKACMHAWEKERVALYYTWCARIYIAIELYICMSLYTDGLIGLYVLLAIVLVVITGICIVSFLVYRRRRKCQPGGIVKSAWFILLSIFYIIVHKCIYKVLFITYELNLFPCKENHQKISLEINLMT